MDLSEVRTFFHEFGHALHMVLGGQGQKFARFSGVATEWDFVEAPSQLLELWSIDFDTLTSFARDGNGSPLPRDMHENVLGGMAFGRAIATANQLVLARASLQLHSIDPSGLDFDSFMAQLDGKHGVLPTFPNSHYLAAFGHLVGCVAPNAASRAPLLALTPFFPATRLRTTRTNGRQRSHKTCTKPDSPRTCTILKRAGTTSDPS